MKREIGYYWISSGEEWAIAEYNHGWFLTGCPEELPERFVKEIDEHPITREAHQALYGSQFIKIDGSKLPELKNLSNPINNEITLDSNGEPFKNRE